MPKPSVALYPNLVIRFKRDITFPRFSMKQGERWNFEVGPKTQSLRDDIVLGERFRFAGGECLSADVEVVYEGPPGREHAIAAGYIQPSPNTQPS